MRTPARPFEMMAGTSAGAQSESAPIRSIEET
jgi:hypothetical protein